MTILTSAQLAESRRLCAASGVPINYTKAQFNAAVQAVENHIVGQAGAISTAINVATAPLVLTIAQKKQIVRAWALQRFNIESA